MFGGTLIVKNYNLTPLAFKNHKGKEKNDVCIIQMVMNTRPRMPFRPSKTFQCPTYNKN